MKKELVLFMAMVVTMSLNAHGVKVMKGDVLEATYTADVADKAVFGEVTSGPTTGTAKRTGNYDVTWVQLWKNGPKVAEYNVGATSASEYGEYYAWGGSKDKIDDHNTGNAVLTGNNDTATKLWGSNWRMPTQAELRGLLDNCDVVWTTVGGKNGCKFTGKGDYSSNSIFLPAAGYFDNGDVNVYGTGFKGEYWSSTPDDSDDAYSLYCASDDQSMDYGGRNGGLSVRAVLVE